MTQPTPQFSLDSLLSLEETFYNTGFQTGETDGLRTGLIEGRTFGLEKGFEKYVESGILYGKAIVWANRLPESSFRQSAHTPIVESPQEGKSHEREDIQSLRNEDGEKSSVKLPPLPNNSRLARHIKVLYALSESESLDTSNTEEAVSEFDDRVRRAGGKVRVIERIVGECAGNGTEKDGKGMGEGVRM